MARRSYSRSSRSTGRSGRSYRGTSNTRGRRSTSGRKRSTRSGGSRTIRIVLETNAASAVQRPDVPVSVGMKTAAPANLKPRF